MAGDTNRRAIKSRGPDQGGLGLASEPQTAEPPLCGSAELTAGCASLDRQSLVSTTWACFKTCLIRADVERRASRTSSAQGREPRRRETLCAVGHAPHVMFPKRQIPTWHGNGATKLWPCRNTTVGANLQGSDTVNLREITAVRTPRGDKDVGSGGRALMAQTSSVGDRAFGAR